MYMQDWIGAIQAAYCLEGDLETWVESVLDRTGPLLDRGAGVIAYLYSRRPGSPDGLLQAVWKADPALARLHARATSAFTSPDAVRRLARSGTVSSSLSEFLFPGSPGEAEAYRERTGFRDAVGLVVETATGYGLNLVALTPDICRMEGRAKRRWSRVAAHLSSGLRLRLALDGQAAHVSPVEAVLDPAANLLDASRPASGARARQVLRDAVLRRERARLDAHRSDPDVALDLWEGLVAGRWSLVDRFESDGRRFVVAHRNDPDVGDPRGLTRRERQVAEYVGMGRSSKEIAYWLGIGASAVSNAIAGAVHKLGLGGRAELAAFFAEGGLRARLIELDVSGEPLVARVACAPSAQVEHLTSAEREIARDMLEGWTTVAIAERRNTSVRTVETQVRSIYSKLGVRSRVELGVRLSGTADLPRSSSTDPRLCVYSPGARQAPGE